MPPSPAKLSASETRLSLLLGGVVGVRMLGLFMLLPVFVLHGERYAGATPFLLGAALSVYGLTQGLLQIPFGALSDRLGRKTMLVVGLSLFVVGGVFAVFSETIGELIIARAVQGAGAVGTVVLATITDHVREEVRSKANAFIGMGIGLAFFFGLLAGPALAAAAGMDAVFALTAALGGAALVLVVVGLPGERPAHRVVDSPLAVLRHGELRALFGGAFFLHMMMTSCFLLLPAILLDAMGPGGHWLFYAPVLVAAFLPVFYTLHRIGADNRFALPVLVVVCALGEAALPFVGGTLPLVGLTMTLFFFAFNLLEAMLPTRVGALCPPSGRGAAMGMFSTGQFLGVFAGGFIAGWGMELWGAFWISAVAAFSAAAWLAVEFVTRRRSNRAGV